MGIGLRGAGGTLDMSHQLWNDVLEIAWQCDWEPAGTIRPRGETDLNWDGTYLSNDWQTVTEEDAMNIAAALERALVSYPPTPTNKLALLESEYHGRHLSTLLDDEMREFITKVIPFCKAGSFVIT